jgi:redox-regulated HSP33 family molecular chaperone
MILFCKPSALRLITGRSRLRSVMMLSSEQHEQKIDNSDILLSGLNADKDIAIKIVSCRELIQEVMLRQDMTSQATTALGELMTCTLLMGAGLKDDETLQVNLVGNTGLGNVMAITDGELKARGTVRNRSFETPDPSIFRMREMLGDGQVQVVRSHPLWKYPTNGIVALRDVKISLNMALYMVCCPHLV